MKVIHYCSVWLEITQPWLWNLVRFLPQEINSRVVCRSSRNRKNFPGVEVKAFKEEAYLGYLASRLSYISGDKQSSPFLASQLKTFSADLAHSHFGNNGWKALRSVTKRGLPHCISFYGHDVSRLPHTDPAWRGRYRELFAAPRTRFCCEGNHMASCLIKMGCPPDKISIQHLGVEIDHIPFRPRRWEPGEPLRVLIAASFREKKGIPYALEALSRLQRHLPLELTIIGDAGGDSASQAEKKKILGILNSSGLNKVSRLLGYQPQSILWDEAYRHHIFISTSVTASDGDTEGGAPVALIDMAASGIPIVSSFHCDIAEVIRHGETGWLATERDVDSIVAAIEKWLDAPTAWGDMLRAGRRHVEQEYSAAIQGQRLASIYHHHLSTV